MPDLVFWYSVCAFPTASASACGRLPARPNWKLMSKLDDQHALNG